MLSVDGGSLGSPFVLGLGGGRSRRGAARLVGHDYHVGAARVVVPPAERHEVDARLRVLRAHRLNRAGHRRRAGHAQARHALGRGAGVSSPR